MTIRKDMWNEFSTYLFIERKLKKSPGNVNSLSSRYGVLSSYFSKTDFTRRNFNVFLEKMRVGHSESYLNGFIKVAKHLDRFLNLHELEGYSYFRERFTPKKTLSPQECEGIINCDTHHTCRSAKQNKEINLRYKALFSLLVFTGCRIGEAISLTNEDVYPTFVIFRETKNGTDRQVPIPDSLYRLLISLPKYPHNLTFNMRSHHQANKELKKRATLLKIGIPVHNHIFRYSFITTMIPIIGEDDVARIVGHHDLNSTRRYNMVLMEQLRNAQTLHPLLRGGITLEYISSSVSGYLSKIVDPKNFSLSTVRKGNKMFFCVEECKGENSC